MRECLFLKGLQNTPNDWRVPSPRQKKRCPCWGSIRPACCRTQRKGRCWGT